ncbi:formate hydrogenlyase subunit 5 [Klebsiella pneumoniae]|nr:formate hydrogenlyase subunit 5 [Klebsiella pneumoniae]
MSEEKIGQHYLAALHQAFPGVVLDEAWQTKDQLTITVKVNYLPEVVEFLYYQQGGWLSVLFGNDERKLNGHYAVYYVLSMEQGTKCWITVRVEVDANKPEYPSVTPRVPAAVWGEREVRDMYGLVPVGLPDERRLVLPDDWPDELYPLRKDSMDYRQRPAPTTDAETYEFINELGSKKNNVVPIGPLHVTSDEPGHFRLFVDGENIIDADYRLFYVHRGMEKLAETRMGYNEVTFLSDRGVRHLRLRPQHRLHHLGGERDGHRGAGAGADDPRHSAGGGTPALAPAEPRSGLPLYRLWTPALCSSSACAKPR